MPRLTSENLEKEIKEQFLYGHNTKYLSEHYNIPQLRINRILKRQGIEKIPNFYDNSKYYLKRKFNELSLYVNTEVTGNSTVERRN